MFSKIRRPAIVLWLRFQKCISSTAVVVYRADIDVPFQYADLMKTEGVGVS
jgi:hypothetical protein